MSVLNRDVVVKIETFGLSPVTFGHSLPPIVTRAKLAQDDINEKKTMIKMMNLRNIL